MTTNIYFGGKEPNSGLHDLLDEALTNSNLFPHQSSGKFRPSEASVELQTKDGPLVKGHCARSTWFRLKGFPATEKDYLPHQIQRMNVGKLVEESLIETCKIMGIYAGNNIPFNATLDGVEIAGELDAVLKIDPSSDTKYIAECKSLYSYYAQKEVFGRFLNLGKEPGKPRDSYVMQLALYLRHFSKLPEDHPSFIPFGVIYCCDRGDGHYGVFDQWLEEETRVLGDDEVITVNKIKYKSEKMRVPTTTLPYTIEDILTRYRYIDIMLQGNTPPAKDFIEEYDEQTLEMRHSQGLIGKTKYEKWKKSHGPRGRGKEKLGDWQCSWCKFKTLCKEFGD